MKWMVAVFLVLGACTFEAGDIEKKGGCETTEDCLEGRVCVGAVCVEPEEPDASESPDTGAADGR